MDGIDVLKTEPSEAVAYLDDEATARLFWDIKKNEFVLEVKFRGGIVEDLKITPGDKNWDWVKRCFEGFAEEHGLTLED